MFTGIVEVVGTLKRIERRSGLNNLIIELPDKSFLEDVEIGDSILVNGVCLTVTHFRGKEFTAEFMPETENVTSIKSWSPGKRLNLEKALRPGRGLDGHIVQGHIDGVGKVKQFTSRGNERILIISVDRDIIKYIVKKGSIAIDGISLTIVNVTKTDFTVNIIKHTVDITNLKHLKPNHLVNIETDIIGKYVEKFISKEE